MKLIIDIPYEAYYTFKCDLGKGNLNALAEIVANGIPYEERPHGDLISREDLKEHKFVGNKFVQIGGRTNGKTLESINKAYQQGWNDCIDAIIDNAPTVKARPQGKWNYIQAGMCVCPFCGAMPHKLYKDFCANCGAKLKGGAKMKGGDNE